MMLDSWVEELGWCCHLVRMVCVESAGMPVFLVSVNRLSMFPLPFQSDTRKMTPREPKTNKLIMKNA